MNLTAEQLLDGMSADERSRAERVESLLPILREHAREADAAAEFPMPHVGRFREAGLLGLIIPQEYGGLGGSLRDLAAATFALGTACPSTALAFFFHSSTASRGLLALDALEAGKFNADEAPVVRAFAEKLLRKMGSDGMWLANFASESVKTQGSAITIATEATPVEGGFRLNGVKSFGCSTGVADQYLVTAKLAGIDDASGMALFFVDRDAAGVSERQKWDAIGMRGTATHGIVLEDVFVSADDSLAVPGAFVKMMEMSRGSFVGNQLCAAAVYAGAAHAVYRHTIDQLTTRKYKDTGRPLGESSFHREIVGRMAVDMETALLWLRRQIQLETSTPPLRPKDEVVRQWRMCKGEVAEAAFRVAVGALKAGGTGGTGNGGPAARGLRDMAMGLVQGFPSERGRLEAAGMIISNREQDLFGLGQTDKADEKKMTVEGLAPKALIAGQWREPAVDVGRSVCDANTGEALYQQREVEAPEVERAIDCAARAHLDGDLAGLSAEARAELLFRTASEIESRSADIAHADAITTGVTLTTTEFLAHLLPHVFRASGQALLDATTERSLTNKFGRVEIRRLPLGPAAVVCPWNAPSVIAAHKITSALAAGCPVIVKPSEWAPSSCQLIVECLLAAGFPERSVQIVHGGPAPAAQLASDDRIRAVSFTGGPGGGRALATLCAQGLKPIQLELGGNNPMFILPGADLDAASDGIVGALTSLNGQWCRALGRLFVHDSVYDKVWESVTARLEAVAIGSSLDRESHVGPLAHEGHRSVVAASVESLVEAGGTAHQFGKQPTLAGWFHRPTLITGLDASAADREIFGPVAAVHRFDEVGPEIAHCNASSTGLAGYVFGPEDAAMDVARRLRIGQVKLNGVGVLGLHPDAPRPAWRDSGLGDEGNAETLEFFRGTQVLGPAGPAPGGTR